jgi:hypothetical protein
MPRGGLSLGQKSQWTSVKVPLQGQRLQPNAPHQGRTRKLSNSGLHLLPLWTLAACGDMVIRHQKYIFPKARITPPPMHTVLICEISVEYIRIVMISRTARATESDREKRLCLMNWFAH